jgi:hypothetical protein
MPVTDTMKPFADDASVLTTGDLVVENGLDVIAVHGQLDIARDKAGLAAARALAATFTAIAETLEAHRDLPERAEPAVEPRGSVRNPFGG